MIDGKQHLPAALDGSSSSESALASFGVTTSALPLGGARRLGPFALLLVAQALSGAGAQATMLLVSYVAVADLHLSPFRMGVLSAAARAPFLFFGLLAGWVADHYSKSMLMTLADGARALLLVMLGLLVWCGGGSVWTLVPLNFLIFTATVFFDVSYSAQLPELVPRASLTEKNSHLEASRALLMTIASLLAGCALGRFAPGWTSLATALVFMASARCLVRLPRTPPRAPAPIGKLRLTLMAGFHSIRSDFNFSVLCLFGMIWNCIAAAESALVFMQLHDRAQLSAGRIGFAFTTLNLAGVAGAYAVGRWKHRLTLRALTGLAMSLTALGWLLISQCGPRYGVVSASVGLGMTGFFTAIYNVATISYRQDVTPAELQGRVIATIRFAMWGMMPIGGLLGGLVADAWGVPSAMTGAACALLLACVILAFLRPSPVAPPRGATSPSRDKS